MKFTILILCFFGLGSQAQAKPHVTWEEFNQRFSDALSATLSDKVILEDLLGEGDGAWDSDPRYPTKTVNCIIWLQLVISEIYGRGVTDKTAVMDRIRYYGGKPAFSLRKHFTDQWLAIEPAPLARVDLSGCAPTSHFQARLKPEMFLKHLEFSCPLYQMARTSFDVEYTKPDGIKDCVKALAPGHYILFAVPTDSYKRKYLSETGPMGLVHAMVLRIEGHPSTDGVDPTVIKTGTAVIYHASTSSGQVLKEPLSGFLERSRPIHQGYVMYELDPDWDFTKPTAVDTEAMALLACEAKLPKRKKSQPR